MRNPLVLKGWDYSPRTKGKVWYFTRDEQRYGDKLLHCTIGLNKMKCFAGKDKFYIPKKPNVSESKNQDKMNRIQEIHR